MNQQRDRNGRFRRIADEIGGLCDLLILSFKLALIGFAALWINSYFNLGEILKSQFTKVVFGNNCKVICK